MTERLNSTAHQKSPYPTGQAQHFVFQISHLFLGGTQKGNQALTHPGGDYGLGSDADFLPLFTEVLYKIVSELFVHARLNPIGC